MMAAWAGAFFLIHYLLVFGIELTVGMHPDELSLRGRALYHLAFDVCNLAATCALLLVCLRRWASARAQVLTLRVRPLWKWAYVALCCVMFPALLQLASLTQVCCLFSLSWCLQVCRHVQLGSLSVAAACGGQHPQP